MAGIEQLKSWKKLIYHNRKARLLPSVGEVVPERPSIPRRGGKRGCAMHAVSRSHVPQKSCGPVSPGRRLSPSQPCCVTSGGQGLRAVARAGWPAPSARARQHTPSAVGSVTYSLSLQPSENIKTHSELKASKSSCTLPIPTPDH